MTGRMTRDIHVSVDIALEFYIQRLVHRIGMLKLLGNRPGMMNDTEKLPQYQKLLDKLQRIQVERRVKK